MGNKSNKIRKKYDKIATLPMLCATHSKRLRLEKSSPQIKNKSYTTVAVIKFRINISESNWGALFPSLKIVIDHFITIFSVEKRQDVKLSSGMKGFLTLQYICYLGTLNNFNHISKFYCQLLLVATHIKMFCFKFQQNRIMIEEIDFMTGGGE